MLDFVVGLDGVEQASFVHDAGGRSGENRSKRAGGVGMVAPAVTSLPSGTFYRWMREEGKLGDQHKVPRVTNDRLVASGLLGTAGAGAVEMSREAVA